MSNANTYRCYLCRTTEQLKLVGTVLARPERETDFGIAPSDYNREIYFCDNCGVYNNFHHYDLDSLYTGTYNAQVYSNRIADTFDRIMALPPEGSDNKQRVSRVLAALEQAGLDQSSVKALDVGSGLGVFPAEMAKRGIHMSALDPDPLSAEHIRKQPGIANAWACSFEELATELKFDLISFNKVLEHVKDPVSLLKQAMELLTERGILYIELPEGHHSKAAEGVVLREEFFMEHYTIFTAQSMRWLAEQSGLDIIELEEIHEPSDKYTVFAFVRPKTVTA